MNEQPKTSQRPWGNFRQFTNGEPSTVKIITVETGERLSLQYHHHRQEFWMVLSGQPEVTIGTEVKKAEPGDEFKIAETVPHRLAAPSGPAEILEISFGQFDENDIVRLEDDYGRS